MDYGTVFEMVNTGSGYSAPAMLANLNGGHPFTGLIIDAAGDLFGTTRGGGAYATTAQCSSS